MPIYASFCCKPLFLLQARLLIPSLNLPLSLPPNLLSLPLCLKMNSKGGAPLYCLVFLNPLPRHLSKELLMMQSWSIPSWIFLISNVFRALFIEWVALISVAFDYCSLKFFYRASPCPPFISRRAGCFVSFSSSSSLVFLFGYY